MNSDMHHRALSVGEVARRAGISVSALHFYEKQGLIESWRTSGNQRRYHRSVLRLIAIIRIAQRVGIPLADIKAYLPSPRGSGAITGDDWAAMSRDWHRDLDQRITLLTRLRDQLDSCIGCGCLSIANCPLRNPNDRAAAYGPGARIADL